MTLYNLPPNPEMRKRHSALMPMMKYLFHQHFQEPQYRGTYYETLLTDLENATKIVQSLLSRRQSTPLATYVALRDNQKKWNTPSAFNMASDALRIGEEMIYRACYVCEKNNINFDHLRPMHPVLAIGKKAFTSWVSLMGRPDLVGVDCRPAYQRWVKQSSLGRAFEAERQRYNYAIMCRRKDLGDTGHVCVVSKKWLVPAQNATEKTR